MSTDPTRDDNHWTTELRRLPRAVPSGLVLVHNHVRPVRRLGARGFRAWLSPPSDQLSPCPCGWAPELGHHFIPRAGTGAAATANLPGPEPTEQPLEMNQSLTLWPCR
jgi:hypothetical protein